jgi:guanylate kinase
MKLNRRGKVDIIYCLVGPSGSGKTTIAKALHDEGYNVIQSYTTRPPREPGEWGHTFTMAVYDDKPPWEAEDVIAYNQFNGNHYWATLDQVRGKTVYIIDPPGDKQLRETVDCPIITIFLRVGREVAFHRMDLERGRRQALERVEHDSEIFASVKADWVVDAERSVREVLDSVRAIIGGKP